MAVFDPSITLVHWRRDGTVVASHGNLMVQLRVGALSAAIIDHVETQGRLARASTRGRSAAVIVVSEHAPLANEELRARQQQLVAEFLRDPRTRLALVVEGESVSHAMARAAARSNRAANVQAFARVADAASWIAPHVERDPAEIVALIEHVRPLAEP